MSSFNNFAEYVKDPDYRKKLAPKKFKREIRLPIGYGKQQIEERWKIILNSNKMYSQWMKENESEVSLTGVHYKDVRAELLDEDSYERSDVFKNNIENYIGTVKVPVAVAGPVRVNGMNANGDYFVPLATTEAALVASVARGITAINQSGGATAITVQEATNRDPVFLFDSIATLGEFIVWAQANEKHFKEVSEKTSSVCRLKEIRYIIEGPDLHMRCQFFTGDASGQNMVTLAAEKIVEFIMDNCPEAFRPADAYLDGNMSGDKKASFAVHQQVRGRKVVVEITIPKEVVKRVFHCQPETMIRMTNVAIRGLQLNGSLSTNLHLSNAYTALSIATGQDPACAAEAHVGISRCELTKNGDIFGALTLPNLLCATVGGGTKLPSQLACLKLMGLSGRGKANAYAEVMAVVMMAGEMSLGSAICSGDFARAHKLLARGTDTNEILDTDNLDDQFTKAQALLVKVETVPSKDEILQIYGLYKQATVGNINISKPAMFSFDLKAKAKYSAWKKLRGTDKLDAKKQYINLVIALNKKSEEKKAQKKASTRASAPATGVSPVSPSSPARQSTPAKPEEPSPAVVSNDQPQVTPCE